MSIESAKAFLERIKNDEDFAKIVGELGTTEQRMEFAKKAGFDFTMEEIAMLDDDISDDELNAVAGGDAHKLGLTPC